MHLDTIPPAARTANEVVLTLRWNATSENATPWETGLACLPASFEAPDKLALTLTGFQGRTTRAGCSRS